MIERYTNPEMGNIWTLENEFRTMLRVEILACEAMNKLGIVPDDALHDIQTKADFRIEGRSGGKLPHPAFPAGAGFFRPGLLSSEPIPLYKEGG